MASAHEPEQFATRWNDEVWGNRNLDAIDDLIADEFVLQDPSLPDLVRGPDGVREVVEMIFSAFPDLRVHQEDLVAEGDRLATRNTIDATHQGEYMGIEPTGATVDITVVTFQEIRDGQLIEEWQLVDRLGLLSQLGAVDRPTASEDPRSRRTGRR